MAAFAEAGFTDVRITERFDCFAGTSKEKTARRYGVMGVNLSATRAEEPTVTALLLATRR